MADPFDEGVAAGATAPALEPPRPEDVVGSIGSQPGTDPLTQGAERNQQVTEERPPLVPVDGAGELKQPRPTTSEIFRSNSDDAYYRTTLAGTGTITQLRDLAEGDLDAKVNYVLPGLGNFEDHTMLPGEEAKAEATKRLNKIKADLIYGEVRPRSETPMELLVAVGGQIAGSMQSPEALLGVPVRFAKPVAAALEKAAGPLGERLALIGTQNAATAVALDPAIQASAIAAGIKGDYEAMDTILAAPTGFVGGVAFGVGVEGLKAGAKAAIARIRNRGDLPQSPPAQGIEGNQPATPAAVGETPAPTASRASPPEVQEAITARQSAPAVDVPEAKPGAALESGGTYRFRIQDLKTDPEAFQYKSGGDAEGVTGALKGVEVFDEAKAGRVITWQNNAGELFVADGHQRTGLARRLIGEGKAPEDQGITGLLYREADGYTASDVRSIAAAANIATGTGTAVDAAKVLRTRPDLIDGTLPPNSQIVRDAKGLAALSDDAFGMIVNEVVPEKYGAQVGRAFTNQPEMQGVAMKAIVKADPANADELAVLLERIKSAAVEKSEADSQGSLFGDMFDGPESTVIEEMKIVGRALRRLKSDATLFRGAVKKADRLEATGSSIERAATQGAADEAAKAAFIAEKAFDQAGPIREALTEAARQVKLGKKTLADAANEFAAAVKRENGASNQGEKINTEPVEPTTKAQNSSDDGADDGFDLFGGQKIAALTVKTGQGTKPLKPGEFVPGVVDVRPGSPEAAGAWRELTARQPARPIDDLLATAPKHQEALSAEAKKIAAELGVELKDPGVKNNRARIVEKMEEKGYRDTSQVTDVVRLGFAVNRPVDGDAIMRALGQRFLTLDEGWKTYPVSGFFDRKIMVQFDDGTIGEVQIWPKPVYEAKRTGGQEIYNRTRSAENRGEDLASLFDESAALYANAVEKAGPEWREFYAHPEKGNGGRPLKDASNVSRETERASSTADSLTGDQPSPSPKTANALPADNTAGRPSQDKNSILATDENPSVQPTIRGLADQVERPDTGIARTQGAAAIDVEGLRAINERLAEAIGVPIRQGRLTARGAPGQKVAGQFDTRQNVVRLREIDDYDVLSHEAGHAIEATIPDVKALLRKNVNRRELGPLDYDPARGNISEGFAEFFRRYMTNRAAAQNAAPTFFQEFDEVLRSTRPDLHKDLADAHQAFSDYIAAPSGQVIEANISTTYMPGGIKGVFQRIRNDGLRTTIANFLSDGYTSMLDQRNPIYKGVRALLSENMKRTGKVTNLKAIDDPYKLARLSVDAFNAGHMDLMHGVHGYHATDPTGPSLREALVLALGKPNAFGGWDEAMAKTFDSYLISRRAVFEYGRFERGEIPNTPTAETKGDHLVNIKELEAAHPEFLDAAKMVHEWTRNMLLKKYDAGIISRDQFDAANLIQDYVPFMRDMSDRTTTAGNGGGSGDLAAAGGLDRFRGSSRPIVSPIESLMKSAYDTNVLIRQNDIIKALDRLALEAGPGAGHIVERIPDKEMKATQVNPVEAIRNAARAAGVDPVDADAMVKSVSDLLGDDARASIFRLGEINTKGEPIVFFWDGGTRRALRLADGDFGVAMYQALTGMPEAMKDIWVKTVAKPSAILRAGITTSPDFLIANYFRDQVSAFVLTEGYVPFYSGAKGIMNEVQQRDIARIYNTVGGIAGGANVAALHEARLNRDFQALAKQGYLVSRATSFEGAFKIAEASETGTRLGVFEAAYKRGLKEGLDSYEAALEAAYQARDLIDFGRHGSKMLAAQRLIPFLNASMQGLDKASRKLFEPAIKHLNGRVLTVEDQRDLGNSMKAWAKLSALAMLSMSLRAVYSGDAEYEDVSEYIRATHWVFKLPGSDKLFTVPKPFELAVPMNLAERLYEYFALKDPEAMKRFAMGALEITSPPNALQSIPLIKIPLEVKANKNTFFGSPIVPDHMVGLQPWLQYTARTSTLSKQIGEKTNLSPAVLDHVIAGFTGSWGRGLLTAYDQASGAKGDTGWQDTFVARRFIKDVSKGSLSTQQFWKEVGQRTGILEGASASYKSLIDQGRSKEAADLLASLTSDQQVYVALNRSSFDAETKRLHPLRRARDAIQVVGDLRRDIVFNNVKGIADQEKIELTPSKRRELDDALSHIGMLEARNALAVTGQSGWSQRALVPTRPSYDVVRAISPAIADELQTRYASSKIYTEAAVQRNWPELKKRLAEEGSDASLIDLKADAKGDGYELEGIRQKKAKQIYTVPGRSAAK